LRLESHDPLLLVLESLADCSGIGELHRKRKKKADENRISLTSRDPKSLVGRNLLVCQRGCAGRARHNQGDQLVSWGNQCRRRTSNCSLDF
jgi:hypothetical protein